MRLFPLISLIALTASAFAVELKGPNWLVIYNHPDGSSFSGFSDDEFAIMNHLAKRLGQLQRGDHATLSTFTWSGNATGAGRLMYEMDRALARGARVRFIGDSDTDTTKLCDNRTDHKERSLDGLKLRWPDTFELSIDDSEDGIHHNKLALFDFSASGKGKLVLTSSQNLTGASSFQWNIAVEFDSEQLYGIYYLEAKELLAGRFHDHPRKSHFHDNRGALIDTARVRARFAPSPDKAPIATALASGIRQARERIVFAINRFSDKELAEELVKAAGRGVEVIGVIPKSEHTTKSRTWDALKILKACKDIQLVNAWNTAAHESRDTGKQHDLVHCKYMVIDATWVLHGSANWTQAALREPDSNDENLLIIHSPEIAAAFLQQFEDMTGDKAIK